MPAKEISRSSELRPNQVNRPTSNTIRVDSDTESLKFGTGASGTTEKEVLDTAMSAATVAGGGADIVVAKEVTFTETAGAGTYTGSVSVPAGATIHDIYVNGVALWNPATSATLKVGDVANDAGYYTGVDLKATDLLAGESLSFALAGGKAGAYIANSQVSPRYSSTARVISGIVTVVGGSGTTGRTRMTVIYSLPKTITAATKV